MTSTTDQSDIATIWSQLHQRIDSEPGESYAMCFLPRHAIRAFHGEDSRDYLICFECDHLYVYREQEADDYERIGLEKGNQPLKLNELIDRAKIPRDHPSCKSVTLSRSAQSPWAFRRNAPR